MQVGHRVTHLKRFFSCNQRINLVYKNFFCGSATDLATWFKIGAYLLNSSSVTNAFLRSTDKIQVLNKLTADKRQIKVPRDRLLCPTHVDNKNRKCFRKKSF